FNRASRIQSDTPARVKDVRCPRRIARQSAQVTCGNQRLEGARGSSLPRVVEGDQLVQFGYLFLRLDGNQVVLSVLAYLLVASLAGDFGPEESGSGELAALRRHLRRHNPHP